VRWRAERWMKLRHLPNVFLHNPSFVMRYWPAMTKHTFAGTTVRSMLGLEPPRAVFERYRQIRRSERNYVDR
jgi:anaerobic magnesium-protoporphyrin IX monomethyl ester cyclase